MLTQSIIEAAAIPIAEILQRYFELQQQEAIQEIQRHGQRASTDLSHWTEPMVEALMPIIAALWQDGMERIQERIANARRMDRTQGIANRQRRSLSRHGRQQTAQHRRGDTVASVMPLGRGRITRAIGRRKDLIDPASFEVFNPRVLQAVEHWTYAFCQATNDTSTMRLDLAIDEFKRSLGGGLQAGDTIEQLARRTGEIFSDPFRAFRIATTEVSRAQHGGQHEAMRDSGEVSTSRWLASADACPVCLSLAGKEVPLDEPFYVWPNGKDPYRIILFAPAHPSCFCTNVPVLN